MVHIQRTTLKGILITMVMDHMGMAQALEDIPMGIPRTTILGIEQTLKFIPNKL